MSDNGKYRPFEYIKRDCKKCRKYLGKEKHNSGAEYMRCELAENMKVPYIEDGIICAQYEERE